MGKLKIGPGCEGIVSNNIIVGDDDAVEIDPTADISGENNILIDLDQLNEKLNKLFND